MTRERRPEKDLGESENGYGGGVGGGCPVGKMSFMVHVVSLVIHSNFLVPSMPIHAKLIFLVYV
jgi:hypothetical protein